MPFEIDQEVMKIYQWVQKDKGAGKWLVCSFHKGKKANRVKLEKCAIMKSKHEALKKKAKTPYDDMKSKLDEEHKDADTNPWLHVENNKDATSKLDEAKAHHAEFIKAMQAVGIDNKRPAIGVIELFTKVFYVTLCDDVACDNKLKPPFASSRGMIKEKLATTNCDVEATDNDELSFEYFEKQAPKHLKE